MRDKIYRFICVRRNNLKIVLSPISNFRFGKTFVNKQKVRGLSEHCKAEAITRLIVNYVILRPFAFTSHTDLSLFSFRSSFISRVDPPKWCKNCILLFYKRTIIRLLLFCLHSSEPISLYGSFLKLHSFDEEKT